jgi:hypothetical protein
MRSLCFFNFFASISSIYRLWRRWVGLLISPSTGGRTAWSCFVVVCGKRIQARYWYDGNNLNNAQEDAAEAAILWLSSQN